MINQRDLNQLCTQHYREHAKEADKFQNQRCFVHSLTLSFCVGVVNIQNTRYGYLAVIIIAVIIIIDIIIIIIIIIIITITIIIK